MDQGFNSQFANLDDRAWHRAHYQFTHPDFDTDWSRAHVVADAGLTLLLRPQAGHNGFLGASIRRQAPSHFGTYSARMKAARGDGLVTGFFLYTGAAYGTPHHEIDWEFLGRDTTRAQVSWWVDGAQRNATVPLGFDAADRWATYAIHWSATGITWSVDGRVVYEATRDIPQTPMRLFANLWAADRSIAGWAGHAAPDTTARVQISTLAHRPQDETHQN